MQSLRVNSDLSFPTPIGTGGSVLIQVHNVDLNHDVHATGSDDTVVELISNAGDQLLHMSFRRADDVIVFNSKKVGCDWGTEQRTPLHATFPRSPTSILIKVQPVGYVVLVDGAVAKEYSHVIPGDVARLVYGSESGSHCPLFSDEIAISSSPNGAANPPPPLPPQKGAPLFLEDELKFDRPFGDGSSIVFYSTYINLVPDFGHDIDNTSINILSADKDTLLHVSIRRAENAVVFNSQTQGSAWQQEERVRLQGVFERTDATIAVRLHADEWLILVDGHPIKTYKQRVHKPAAAAAYRTNAGQVSVFSNPIYVTAAAAEEPEPPASQPSAPSYEKAYFPLTPAEVAAESEQHAFDYVIIGSGIGGGVLAADLLDKNKRLNATNNSFAAESTAKTSHLAPTTVDRPHENQSSDGRSKRILVVEAGGLLFNTHSLNMPRPTDRKNYGQLNDLFYNHFKTQWDMDVQTAKVWKGGKVHCLGGRSTVWGLFSPRINDDTFRANFPGAVYTDLTDKGYLRKAEETMNVSYPRTLPLHRAVIDRLNINDRRSGLPQTQWTWGRVASEFSDGRNFDFAEGAYSTTDRLLEAAMDDPQGQGDFKSLLWSSVQRLEPAPHAGETSAVTHVVVKDRSGAEHKIQCKNAIVSAGAIDGPAILLRSAQERGGIRNAFGREFEIGFGHVTDHYICFVTMPFFYRNVANKDIVGGMKLQTDITFNTLDNTTALANIALDASGFLPRRNMPDSQLPQFIIAYILPSELNQRNFVELNKMNEPYIHVGYAPDPRLQDKKNILIDFAVDVMNKLSLELDLQFVQHDHAHADYAPLKTVTRDDVELGELGPGGVAHEMGSIPMPNADNQGGLVDTDLKLKYGWSNVYCCDLGVFPYSPAANPTLSLAALALRLSDHLIPPETTQYQPIVVFNLLPDTVYVSMSLSNAAEPSFGPPAPTRVEIRSGGSHTWKRATKETISVYASASALSFGVQMVRPGVNALITTAPPKDADC